MLELEAKEVGIESERVFVVSMVVELEVGKGGVKVGEEEGEGGRKVMLELEAEEVDEEEEEVVGVNVNGGGQGGKVNEIDEDGLADDDAVSVMLESELDELGLDDAVGMLKVKLEGKSKVMDDGMSGTDVEYDG